MSTMTDDRPQVADPLPDPAAAGSAVATVPQHQPQSAGLVGGALIPNRFRTMQEKVHWCQQMAGSSLLPKEYRGQPANLMFALEYGELLRISTMAVIQGVHVIDGKPTASAGLMTMLVRRAGHKIRSGYEPGPGGSWGHGWCEITRADDPEYTFRAVWTLDDAVRALLCKMENGQPWSRSQNGKPQNWEKYPRAMLKARAISECVRMAAEDVLFGVQYTAEEMGVEVDPDGLPLFVDGQVIRTDGADIADRLVTDTTPDIDSIDWDAEIALCKRATLGETAGSLAGMLAKVRGDFPDAADLHDRITAAVPWDGLLDEFIQARNLQGLYDLHRRARGMRPDDAELLTRIEGAGTALRDQLEAEKPKPTTRPVAPKPTRDQVDAHRAAVAQAVKHLDYLVKAGSKAAAEAVTNGFVELEAVRRVDVGRLVPEVAWENLGLGEPGEIELEDLAIHTLRYWEQRGQSPFEVYDGRTDGPVEPDYVDQRGERYPASVVREAIRDAREMEREALS